MNISSHCACRTAALRIFVRSLVGPVPAAATRTPTTARQWRSLTTASRPGSATWSMSRFQSANTPTTSTTTRAFRVSRRQLNNAQQAAAVEAAAAGSDNAKEAEVETTTAAVAAAEPELAAANPTPTIDDVAAPAQPPVEEAEIELLQASSPPLAETQAAGDAKLGKNMKKRIRRQLERERLEAEAAEVAAKKPKVKKVKKEKKTKLEKKQEELEAKRLAKKEIRKERRALEKGASSGTTAPASDVKPKRKPTAEEEATLSPTAPTKGSSKTSSKSSSISTSASTPTSKSASTLKPLPKTAEQWQIQKRALRAKFPEGWNPRKKLSPDALEGIRALHRQFPEVYTTAALAGHFQVSAEAIRRILKSTWEASPKEEEDRQARWFDRGKQVWARWAALGRKPPKRWQAEGILREPSSWSGGRQRQQERLQEAGERQSVGRRRVQNITRVRQSTRQTRQQFQYRLSEEGVNESRRGGSGGGGGGGDGDRGIASEAAVRRAIEASADVDSPARSMPSSSERSSFRPRMKSQSKGRLTRLRRTKQSFTESEEHFHCHLETRAKCIVPMTLTLSDTSLAILFATFIPLPQISWRTWRRAGCRHFYYYFMVETRGRTLEEMDCIFVEKGPRRVV